ncbi:hypothetical protein [Actinoplanes sp. URMC 104]|uniref:hypothetical protein n=1 Tax=Actinoplanes sp. URMC 104 TaxID=3423409 RepID=UPI003F1A1685
MSSPRIIVPAAAAALLLLAGSNAGKPAKTNGAATKASTASVPVSAAPGSSEAAPPDPYDQHHPSIFKRPTRTVTL